LTPFREVLTPLERKAAPAPAAAIPLIKDLRETIFIDEAFPDLFSSIFTALSF